MKKIINVAFPWPKDDITKAWSGSAYQIKCQLEKDYDVNIIDTTLPPLGLRIVSFLVRLNLRGLAKLISLSWMSRIVNKKSIAGDLFTFDTIRYKKGNVYWYSDCSYSYLYKLSKEQPELFKYTNFSYSKLECKLLKKFQDAFFYKCKAIFVMGQHLKDHFDNEYDREIAQKVFAVGGGINFSSNAIQAIDKENSFIFVGKDFIRKSGDLVINAFNELNKEKKDIVLYIIGPSQKPENCDNENIKFLGELPFSETKKYFEKSKVFVMPSRFEAYGLVFLEALCCGCVLIAQDNFEMHYFVNKNNGLFTKLTVDDLKLQMKTAIEDQNMQHYVVEQNQFYCKSFSWDAVYNRMKQGMN
ncbi:MAG: glycosyltransferase family 4 protein [Firmicutes bacterium]|nr:glycosyltransferase family 4 protein [Bacillota bacterium]MDY6160894.1 glycosyltransferase family 4 protein [Candidatus Faecousia sp.]